MNLAHPYAVGNTADIYRFNNRIIKVFKEGFSENEAVHEAEKQVCAYKCGLDVPEVIEVTEINGRQSIIMEYIEGTTIGERLLGNMEQADYYIDNCVQVQQTIHLTDIQETSIEWMTEKLTRQIISTDQLSDYIKDLLLYRLNSMKFVPRLCHGDFHPFNIIVNKNKMTIIDWVDSSIGDIRADVYRTYLMFSQSSTILAQKYLHSYCLQSGLSQEEVFQWAPIVAGARLSEQIPLENKKHLRKIIDFFI